LLPIRFEAAFEKFKLPCRPALRYLSKPYYRIVRPAHDGLETVYSNVIHGPYVRDARYAPDRQELWRAYKLIEKDLLRLFEYIEPRDDNIAVYSHRTYELLLRASTEFETNCKRILEVNGYSKRGDLNIREDYSRINRSSRLAEYSVSLVEWYPEPIVLKPFNEWSRGYRPLTWYRSYNDVKHDRNSNFRRASLDNVLNAIAGLYVVLFSQFCCHKRQDETEHRYEIRDDQHIIWATEDIFEVMPPLTWTDNELYGFYDPDTLADDPCPFAKFPF
jgi:hypothetical protein